MKKMITIVLLTTFFIGGVFASGQKENDYFGPQAGPGMGYFQNQEQELMELSGTLELINGNPPYLNADSKKYSLMVPYHLLYNLDIQNGESVSVRGYEMPGHMWQWDDSTVSLYVTNATIKGEEYDLTDNNGGYMMGGGRGFGGRGFGGRRGRGCW